MPQNYHLNLSFVKDRWKPGWWKYGQKLSWNSQLSIAIFSLVSHMVSKVSKLKQSVSSKSQCICIHKITIHYGLIRAIKLHNRFFLTLGYRIQMHVSTIPGNFNKLLTSKATKASINVKIFMINKTQWGEFQCFSVIAFLHNNFNIYRWYYFIGQGEIFAIWTPPGNFF